jgi:hypothetical protein
VVLSSAALARLAKFFLNLTSASGSFLGCTGRGCRRLGGTD